MATESDQREDRTAALPLAVKVWTSLLAVVLVTWFLFAWLILDRHVLDAAGESVGTAFAIAVIVSLIGAVRSAR
jgi:hypothetical protein